MDGYYPLYKDCFRCTYDNCQTCSDSSGCDTCLPGNWGLTCNRACGSGCKAYVCDMSDGSCTCRPGYYGNKLCYRCTYPGCQTCSNSSSCDTCLPGYWGPTCNNACGAGCEGAVCDMSDDSCTCIPGYYGNKLCYPCTFPGCQTCSNSSGCDTCWPGLSGTKCSNSCPAWCEGNVCDMSDYSCTCRSGYVWYRWRCQPCSSPNCLTCSPPDCETCKPGVCFNCLTGYFGTLHVL